MVVFATFSVRCVAFCFVSFCFVCCGGTNVSKFRPRRGFSPHPRGCVVKSLPCDLFRHPFRAFTVVESNEARFVCVFRLPLRSSTERDWEVCPSLLAGLIVVALLVALGTCAVPVLACHTPRTRPTPKLVHPTSFLTLLFLFFLVLFVSGVSVSLSFLLLPASCRRPYDTVTSTTRTNTHRSTHRCVAVRSKNNQVVVVN